MKKIIEILKNNPAYLALMKEKGEIIVSHASDEAILIASAFFSSPKPMLVVKENLYQAQLLYQELYPILKNKVSFFPCDESLRVEALASSQEIMGERISTLASLCQNEPIVVIGHVHSYVRYIPEKSLFLKHTISLHISMTIEPSLLREKLIQSGYQMIQRVDEPFYYSKRGGVIDVYSIQYDNPIRIEFFDDEIESIRFFDKDTQRSLEKVEEVTILPATDLLYPEEELKDVIEKIEELQENTPCDEYKDNLDEEISIDIESLKGYGYSARLYQYMGLFTTSTTLLSYFSQALFISSDYERLQQSFHHYEEETYYYTHELQETGKMVRGLSLYQQLDSLYKRKQIEFYEFRTKDSQISFVTREIQLSLMNEKQLIQQLKDYLIQNKILMCLDNSHQIQMMVELLEENSISYTMVGNDEHIYNGVNIYLGNLKTGIDFYDEHVILLTETELFKVNSQKKKGYIKYKDAKVINDYTELNIGDYVVHDTHGIGQYMGIKTLEIKGTKKDYLYIAYKGNDTLYIPVENFKLVRKYASRDGKAPKIHALNSTEWQKTKQRVKNKVDDLADKLIALYAARMKQPGFAYPQDDALQIQFEECFGYDLTPDQESAVKEIKADMELPRPMDRLLCGDVGFGKTEVALRACFKAILANKQVAFLCPTTILSSQHYHTMIKRFENFPVSIALLNRFTTVKQRKQILADLKDGKIDLLVGTHRILSKDVEFKDLGLLCIDEEQRFGVKQKEKIKEIRETIDVLTLTATPIPRTLQMSLMGIRGLSQIETPPLNRLPVQTYVMEKSEQLIKQVIERELGRKGQVFYLYNKTSNIESVANHIARMIPSARVGIGHGKMTKDQLEDVMQAFTDKEYDVLVCTTIIETGIDIPNANTIIIEDADKFGLAQLYQIKGRVGRSERMAYAYLLYAKHKQMNEEASKRLKAIKEFAQLGSGYKIAMRDLSIRGSGDILGGEQAGFIDSVGFDMYMKILQDTIDEKTGEINNEKEVPVQNISVEGYIPENYVESDIEKLNLYQRIYKAQHLSQMVSLEKELKDLYGTLPREVSNIVLKRKYEIMCTEPFIDSVKEIGNVVQIMLTQEFTEHIQGDVLFELVNRLFDKPQLKYMKNEIVILIPTQGHWLPLAIELLNELKKMQ
ncbi:transcription-repair coupling factor [Candidatus Stoquefichus massiliensis]|uniref:transcription-repair coupling factor n=1 Tax=Candidatus Stoquefichus massiliensis TaxID=1470350 RepID=UPI0004801B1D|nr:transcription-repair coupling factor [Candidatus Stoquefichus massiliensis]